VAGMEKIGINIGRCFSSPVRAHIYADFSHPGHFTMKLEAAWTSETLLSYHDTVTSQPRRTRLEKSFADAFC
jgi:hypothetical protein